MEGGELTGLSERLVVESSGSDFIRVPLIFDELLIDVDDIQMFIL